MSPAPCPECRVSPCYCDTVVEPADGDTAQYARNLRLEGRSHAQPCDHWSPHPKDGFCVACGWAQVVHDIGSPSDHHYDRMMAAGKTKIVTADDGDPLIVVQDADWAESTERLDAFMAEHDRIVAENERLREAALLVGGDLLDHWAECPLPPDAGCESCHQWAKARAVLNACGQREPPARVSGSTEGVSDGR